MRDVDGGVDKKSGKSQEPENFSLNVVPINKINTNQISSSNDLIPNTLYEKASEKKELQSEGERQLNTKDQSREIENNDIAKKNNEDQTKIV